MNIYPAIKRLLDIVLSLLALMILSPVFLILAIMVKLDSKGGVFFKQGRLGKNGVPFTMYKFRTMVENAEQMGTGLFNYAEDSRVTKVGRFLRDTSLDELPQLLNVLKGDMSLIGPRPPVTYELGDYDTLNARYKKRFTVKPGITGLAQVSGRNELPWDEKVDFDNLYIDLLKKQTILIDTKVFFKTIANVFAKKSIFEQKIDENASDEESAEQAAAEVIRKAHEA